MTILERLIVLTGVNMKVALPEDPAPVDDNRTANEDILNGTSVTSVIEGNVPDVVLSRISGLLADKSLDVPAAKLFIAGRVYGGVLKRVMTTINI